MNIFFLHKNTDVAASMLTDTHVVKMTLETAQLLSTAHRVLDGEHTIGRNKLGHRKQEWHFENDAKEFLLYKATHFNHPVAKWVRASLSNYQWTYQYFLSLSKEYEKRFKKEHLSYSKLYFILRDAPKNIEDRGFTPIVPAVPKEYVIGNVIDTYRNYYENSKLETKKDKKRYFSQLKLAKY